MILTDGSRLVTTGPPLSRTLELLKIEVFPGRFTLKSTPSHIFPTGKSPRHTFAIPCTVIETYMMYASDSFHVRRVASVVLNIFFPNHFSPS